MIRRSVSGVSGALLAAAVLVACGGGDESTDQASEGGAGSGNASGSSSAGGGGSGGKAGSSGPGGNAGSGGSGPVAGMGGSPGKGGQAGGSGQGAQGGASGQGGQAGQAGVGGQAGGGSGSGGAAGAAGLSAMGGSSGSVGQAGGSGGSAGSGQAGQGGSGQAGGAGSGQAGGAGQAGSAGSPICDAPGFTYCSGACVDVQNDAGNCGSCGNLCLPTEDCQFGSCKPHCDQAGISYCNGACVFLENDPQHCGACDIACDPGFWCAAGQCVTDCGGPGHTLCGKQCTDLSVDPQNCGACGLPCAAGETCVQGLCLKPECAKDADCADPQKPFCDPATLSCVQCLANAQAPMPALCQGVCSLVPPLCVNHQWSCTGPAYEPVEQSCDGFDNDCDGQVDEGVCQTCSVPIDKIQQNLNAIWDIDFDFTCTTYLTTLISGPDYTRVISPDAAQAPQTYYGNLNQNMGFALVDPDPNNRRVVVSYSCGNASCLAKNGLTLLYTCGPQDPGCGCAGQSNCPGFLNTPFLPTGLVKTALTFNGFEVGTPTGLAAGAGNRYFVGNFEPLACDSSPSCVPCDPAHPGVVCSPSKAACCDTSPFGRLAEFTLPAPGVEPTFRVDRVLEGEQIFGLASGRDGSVWVGTYVSPTKGNLYRYDPIRDLLTLKQTFGGAIFSLSQSRKNGDWYVEVRGTPKLVRLDEQGSPLPLPATVPDNPPAEGVLQVGPDYKLYRLIGKVDAPSQLSVYDIP